MELILHAFPFYWGRIYKVSAGLRDRGRASLLGKVTEYVKGLVTGGSLLLDGLNC